MTGESAALRDGKRLTSRLLPPGQTLQSAPPAPRVSAGSFLVGEHSLQVDPERMVPTEEVMPGIHQPLLLVQNLGLAGRKDIDHTRFQDNDPRLQGDDRRPLRYCFCQLTARVVHERKNDAYDAVRMPVSDGAVFQAVLLGVAKYVPRRAIDLSGRQPRIIDTSESLNSELRKNVMIQPGTAWKIGYYLARYTIAHGLAAVRESEEVYRFVEARDEQARKLASFGVVRRALGIVLDPFEPVYERALRNGAIRRPEPTAARFVLHYFNQRQPDYVPTIVKSLQAA